jgi:hypothetical protein
MKIPCRPTDTAIPRRPLCGDSQTGGHFWCTAVVSHKTANSYCSDYVTRSVPMCLPGASSRPGHCRCWPLVSPQRRHNAGGVGVRSNAGWQSVTLRSPRLDSIPTARSITRWPTTMGQWHRLPAKTRYRRLSQIELPVPVDRYPTARYSLAMCRTPDRPTAADPQALQTHLAST